MGPKVKKPAKNAFSLFLEEYVDNERKKGRQVSYKIAAEECAPLWQELPEEEKQYFQNLAGVYKMQNQNDLYNKFTTTGVSFAQIERDQKEIREKTEKADAEIKLTISNLDLDLLKTHLFYVVHCNYYCKTDAGFYLPGEIAIAEFSLGEGIRRTFHTLVNPGSIPLGYAFEAKQTIEEVHGLPYPPYEEGESDYFGILRRILDFLEPGKLPDGRYSPLYTIENNMKASENILQALSDNRSEGKHYFRIYSLPKMFFWLKNKCVEDIEDESVSFPVLCNAETEISKDIFCYVPGISCSFHNSAEDKYHNCSLSVVQRLIYIVCDHCCQYIGVELVPGKHCYVKSDTKRVRTAPSSRSSNISRPPTEVGESEFDRESSYAGGIGWRNEGAATCYLHDELDSIFSALEVSSVGSRSTHQTLGALVGRGRTLPRVLNGGRNFESESDDDRLPSVGRGKLIH